LSSRKYNKFLNIDSIKPALGGGSNNHPERMSIYSRSNKHGVISLDDKINTRYNN